jgi:hypothetical protein
MKKIINFIIDQELESLDDFPSLAKPISEKFNIELETAEKIINEVIGWETSSTTIESLEELLNGMFPNIVTN